MREMCRQIAARDANRADERGVHGPQQGDDPVPAANEKGCM